MTVMKPMNQNPGKAGRKLCFLPIPKEGVEKLLSFYDGSHRSLPWREEMTPYRVLVSELMLQQTRVEAVLAGDYFGRFLQAFPDVKSLAEGSEEQLLKLWQGLGYYSRAKNLQKAARVILERYGGEFPSSPELLKELPGIGDYTAGAVASIAFGIQAPAVDGNVLRVLSRLSACEEELSLSDPVLRREAQEVLLPVIPADRAGDFTQAMIELGATVCIPVGNPRCEICPFASFCKGKASGNPKRFPLRKKKAPRRKEVLTVLVLRDTAGVEDRYYLRLRPDHGLLASLLEFPNFPGILTTEEVVEAASSIGFRCDAVHRFGEATHVFSHVEWHMTLYEAQGIFFLPRLSDRSVLATKEELGSRFAVPSAFSACLSKILSPL